MALLAFTGARTSSSSSAITLTAATANHHEGWKQSINDLWKRRDQMLPAEKKKAKYIPGQIPANVWSIPGHQWGHDPNLQVQMGIGGGLSRVMRRMTVRRQDLWTNGPAAAGQPDFIHTGHVPPKVPILGNAKMFNEEHPADKPPTP
eukprot:CAMPEP_0181317968 /NCGR_PEP_ID=MMETSP1101-20121128/16753_1 /TAXON_ID=46948 /ORGANISM="Rhodomonas abbreviata, Strain Caron Lab Isolate" /LENGTH=146 /DNA_ID=CAMNT_0023425401 /DNA_START=175 /DNA_END=615 /DNA_ORIENTATION=+